MDRMFKILSYSKKDLETINEFKYNVRKKNSLRDSIAFVIHNLKSDDCNNKNNLFTENLLSDSFSIYRIQNIVNKYDFDNYNLLDIYKKIDSCQILEEIDQNCKITEEVVNNINSLVEIQSLIKEFKSVNILKKPDILIKLLYREKSIKSQNV